MIPLVWLSKTDEVRHSAGHSVTRGNVIGGVLGSVAGVGLLIAALVLALRARTKRRSVRSSHHRRYNEDGWSGPRMGESKAASLPTVRVPPAISSAQVSGMRQTELGTMSKYSSDWSMSSAGRSSIFISSPPDSSTQLIFPRHETSDIPSPARPIILVTGPDLDEEYRPPTAQSFTDAFVPLETPIDRHSNNPFLNYDLSAFVPPGTEAHYEGSNNPFLARLPRDSVSSYATSCEEHFGYAGTVLGQGEISGGMTTVAYQRSISSYEADVVRPPSPVDTIDRFWDIPDTSGSVRGASLEEALHEAGQAPTERLRALSPGPVSWGDPPTHARAY